MSLLLPHLHSGWAVDQAIVTEEDRIVLIRFGNDHDPDCMEMDEILYSLVDKLSEMCVIYVVDNAEVPDFNVMYELYDNMTLMFFYRNKRLMIDHGTGDNNKVTLVVSKQDLIDMVEMLYVGARKGKGLIVFHKDFSTKQKF